MPISMPREIRNLSSRLTAALALAMAASFAAAAAAPVPGVQMVSTTARPQVAGDIQQLDQLDEIMVRGNRAAVAIADVEDDYYKLYNKLNKDDRYDVNCTYLNTDPDNPGSGLQSRVCFPRFVADAMAEWVQGRCEPPDFFTLDTNKNNRLSETEITASKELIFQFLDLDTNYDRSLSYTEFINRSTEIPPPCYQPPPPDLILMQGSEAWRQQMTKVTNGDPRLHEMASYLGSLYYELHALQRQYVKVEATHLPKSPHSP